MENKTFNDSKISLSDFNEGGFQILRLHDYWNDCGRYARQGNFEQWKWTLDMVWLELSADAELSKRTEAYNKELNLSDKRIKLSKNKDQLYYSLMKKQQFLKRLQDEVGKGAKRSKYHEEIM